MESLLRGAHGQLPVEPVPLNRGSSVPGRDWSPFGNSSLQGRDETCCYEAAV